MPKDRHSCAYAEDIGRIKASLEFVKDEMCRLPEQIDALGQRLAKVENEIRVHVEQQKKREHSRLRIFYILMDRLVTALLGAGIAWWQLKN